MSSEQKLCPDCGERMAYIGQFTAKHSTGVDYECPADKKVWRRLRTVNTMIHKLRKSPVFSEPE